VPPRLTAGTPYYFCAIAQNVEGTGFGSVVSFTPDDPPAVDSTFPVDGAAGVAVYAGITITFTEGVTVHSWFAISCDASGTHTAAESGGPITYTLNPDTDFAPGELCTVSIYSEGVADIDAYDPPDTMVDDHVFSFTVGPPFRDRFSLTASKAVTQRSGRPSRHDGCHPSHCCITGIPFAQVGWPCGSLGAGTGGGKPRPYGGCGDSRSVHQCG